MNKKQALFNTEMAQICGTMSASFYCMRLALKGFSTVWKNRALTTRAGIVIGEATTVVAEPGMQAADINGLSCFFYRPNKKDLAGLTVILFAIAVRPSSIRNSMVSRLVKVISIGQRCSAINRSVEIT